MSLTNNNFINFDGSVVGGRTPAKVRVLSDTGQALTPYQLSGVAGAYQEFCTKVKLSIAEQHSRQVFLLDGTKIQMSSISGVDSVVVWPSDSGGEEGPPSGIGICFTTMEGLPVEAWSYRDAEGNSQPQPLILHPRARKSKTSDGRYKATGAWDVIKVPKLLGGQSLWVSSNQRMWLSRFASPTFAQPAALYERVVNNRILPDAEPGTLRLEWTAASQERIGLGASSDITLPPFAQCGEYIFRLNDTWKLNPTTGDPFWDPATSGGIRPPGFDPYPAFITKVTRPDQTATHYMHVILPKSDGSALHVYRGSSTQSAGLAAESANLEGENVYLSNTPIIVPFTQSDIVLSPATLSVHPDGKRAICMTPGRAGYPVSGKFAAITVGEDVTYEITDPGVRSTGEFVHTGNIKLTQSLEITPRFDMNFDSSGYGTSNPAGVMKTVAKSTQIGNSVTSHTDVELNRAYYDLTGKLVLESVTTSVQGGYTINNSYTTTTEPGDTGTSAVIEAEPTVYAYSVVTTTSMTEVVTAKLSTRSIVLKHRVDGYDITAAPNSPTGEIASLSGSVSRNSTTRDILFYDDINDFILYLEMNVKCITNPQFTNWTLDLPATDFSGWLTAETTARIVGMRGATEVFAYTLDSPTVVLNARCPMLSGVINGDNINSRLSFVSWEWPVGSSDQVHAAVFTHHAPIENDQDYISSSYPILDNVTQAIIGSSTNHSNYYWTDTNDASAELPATAVHEEMPASATIPGASDPRNYMQVKYARDPVTLASIVNLTFKGASMPVASTDQSWIFVTTEKSTKHLQDVLKNVPPNVTIDPAAILNSLVSI